MKKFLLLFVLLFSSCSNGPVFAGDWYWTEGIGQGWLRAPKENMWWYQDGYDHTETEKANVYRFGIGKEVNKWLAIELNAHDLGRYERFSSFVHEEWLYDKSSPTLCVNGTTCPNTQHGYMTGRVYALSLSALPKWQITDKWSVYTRIGYDRYWAKFKVYMTSADPQSKSWDHMSDLSDKGSAPLLGWGTCYKQVCLDYTKFSKIHADRGACCSAYRSADQWIISTKHNF